MRWQIKISIVVTTCLPAAVMAQVLPTGHCGLGTTRGAIDIGNVRVGNITTMGYLGGNIGGVFDPFNRYPGGDPDQFLYDASLLISGRINGEIRMRGRSGYSGGEAVSLGSFWPGPIPASGGPPNDCVRYDSVWVVSRTDVLQFDIGGLATGSLRPWPYRLGAPVADGDGIEGNYDLLAGDRPQVLGDQMAWWVMNDLGNTLDPRYGDPLGVEVRGSVYALDADPGYIDPGDWSFYRLQVTNRNSVPITDAYIGWHTFLGECCHKYMASDTSRGLAYAFRPAPYPPDDDRFGIVPPAVGITVVQGPLTQAVETDSTTCVTDPERVGLASYIQLFDGGDTPHSPVGWHNVLRGLRRNGEPYTEGFGRVDGPPTRFWFPGDPLEGEFWSEYNIDRRRTANPAGQRETTVGVGPFCIGPGETEEVTFAVIWARGTSHLDSVRKLQRSADLVHGLADSLLSPLPRLSRSHALPPPRYENTATRLHPNPASGHATLRYTVSTTAEVRAELFDAWGRRVRTVVGGTREPGEYSERVDLSGLAPGLYLYRMAIGRAESTGSLVVVR